MNIPKFENPPPPPPVKNYGFHLLNSLYEKRVFLRELSKLYNIDTDIDKEIVKSIKLIDEAILLNLKLINNQ